jgi:hypothetical protein
MTNEELFQDLKQYIDARVVTKEDLSELRRELKDDIAELRHEIRIVDKKIENIAEAIGETVQADETRLDDHQHRITRLERMAA